MPLKISNKDLDDILRHARKPVYIEIDLFPVSLICMSLLFFVAMAEAKPRSSVKFSTTRNDSRKDDYAEFGGQDNWFDISVEYVLPIGAARRRGIRNYHLTARMRTSAPTGGTHWKPMTIGIANLLIRHYDHYLSYETELETVDRTIPPLELARYLNNTDSPPNPSFGSSQYLPVIHDFAWVVYSTVDYRHPPKWNPLSNQIRMRFLKIDWWQFVGFIEGGRVADAYEAGELMRDWKADVGIAVRAFMAGAVVRLDLAFSEEGTSAWVMLGHPF